MISGLLMHLRVPTIKASNFTNYKNQVSSNSPLIMTFNGLMNRSSVESHFTIFPEVRGKFDWTFNKLVFHPEERLKVGETYSLTVTHEATNILGKNLESDYVESFTVVDPPKIALAVPMNQTEVDSKITVMFDRPVVALSTLDELDTHSVPMTIDPPVKGRAKWIGTSAFQFIPETRLDYSTSYTVTIPAGVKTVDEGVLENEYKFGFMTPRILSKFNSYDEPGQLRATDPIRISYSIDVQLQSVLDHAQAVTLPFDSEIDLTADELKGDRVPLVGKYAINKEVYYDEKGDQHSREVEDKKTVEIMPKSGSWGYDNYYAFRITKDVAGIEGNMATNEPIAFKFTTGKFLRNMAPSMGQSGVNPRGDIVLSFEEPVDLDSVRDNFSLAPNASLNFVYGKKCKEDWEPESDPNEKCPEVEDDQVVVGVLRGALPNVTTYAATLSKNVIAKNGQKFLKDDLSWSFTTADTMKILRMGAAISPKNTYYGGSTYRTNKNFCLYSTNSFATDKIEELQKQFVFDPPLTTKLSFEPSVLRFGEDQSYLPCQAKSADEHAGLLVTALMNPLSTYKITVKAGTQDAFGQGLSEDFHTTWKTEALNNEDISLTILQTNKYAIVTPDQHAKPVFSSWNLDSYDVDVCRVTTEKFLEVDTQWERDGKNDYQNQDKYGWTAFAPSPENCTQLWTKTITPPRGYWKSQFMELDLRQLMGLSRDSKLDTGYYFVRARSPKLFTNVYDYSAPNQTRTKPYTVDQILVVSNMHVAIKQSAKNSLFWVNDLTTGKPLVNANLKLYRENGEYTEKSGTTNGQGVGRIALNELPFKYVVVEHNGQSLAVNANWSDGISPWDFKLSSSALERLVQVYTYTDRPIYQPTHTVNFKGIVRNDYDAHLTLPTDIKTASVNIIDSQGNKIYTKQLPLSSQGTFNGNLVLSPDVPLGQYGIEACAVPGENDYCKRGWSYASFYVEEYKKPEYKLDVKFASDTYVNGDVLKADLGASYYYGAPVPDAQVDWTLNAQNYYFDQYEGDWYSFSDYSTLASCYYGCPYSDQFVEQGSGKLDAEGHLIITKKLDLSTKDESGKQVAADTSKLYTLNTSVTDSKGQTVGKSSSFTVHRGEFYLGVKTNSYLVEAKQKVEAQVVAVDAKGQGLGGKSIKLELLQRNWKYVKKKNVDGGFYWDNELENKVIDSNTVTTDGDGKASSSFRVPEGGEYVVTATATDSRNNTFASSMDFYATTGEVVNWKQENNNRMELKLDKQLYNVGDTAHVLVKSPYKDIEALVTYERGDILESRVVKIDSTAYVLDVPITEKMIPNFFVSVLEFKPGNTDSLPDFKLGYADLRVNNSAKELKISINSDKSNYAPGENVTLNIATTDPAQKPLSAEVSVAVVDESVLALKGNPKKDLLKMFYDRRFLGVTTADELVMLLKRVNVNDIKGAKGGGGKGIDDSLKPRGKFEDTAVWKAQVQTDANGKATLAFKLPDNLTTWNIEVVGISADSHVGVATTSVIARKAVMVTPITPRFATYGDEMLVGGTVINSTTSPQKFAVTLKASWLVNTGDETKNVHLAVGESQNVTWKLRVPFEQELKKNAHLIMTADGPNSNDDAVEWDIPVSHAATPETVSTSSFTDDLSYTEKVIIPKDANLLSGGVTVTTGATLATYISNSLSYLVDYPYGCSEQLVSRVVPMVNLKQAFKLVNAQDQLNLKNLHDEKGNPVSFEVMISRTVQSMYANQRSDGGWGYFSGSRESIPYLSAYVVSGLDTLKKAGYTVDAGVLGRGTQFLRDALRSNRDLTFTKDGKPIKTRHWAMNRSYMLFVLSEIGSGDIGLANSLYDDRELLATPGKSYLAMTLHKLGAQSTKVDNLINDIQNNARIDARGTYVRAEDYSGYSMMTNVKSTALALQTFTRISPNNPLIPKMIKWIIAKRVNGTWSTTQETAQALASFVDYMRVTNEGKSTYSARIAINAKDVGTYKVNPQNVLDQHVVTTALKELTVGGDGNTFVFAKEGTGRLYYDIVLNYLLPAEKIEPRSEGFVIQRSYYAPRDVKLTTPLTTAKVGDTLHGRLTIIVPEDRTAVAVEDFMPAGFDLINFNLATADRTVLNGGQGAPANQWDTQAVLNEYDGKGGYQYAGYDDGYYGNDAGRWNHVELRSDRLLLFADYLNKGVYTYDYYVQVTIAGELNNPPAVVSELYFPENFGRTAGEKIKVEELQQ